MTPPKITINHHPLPDGQGKPLKQPQTFEDKQDGAEPQPVKENPFKVPPLAVSMTVTFDNLPGEAAQAAIPEIKGIDDGN